MLGQVCNKDMRSYMQVRNKYKRYYIQGCNNGTRSFLLCDIFLILSHKFACPILILRCIKKTNILE